MTLTDALGSPLRLPAEGGRARPKVGDAWVVSTDGQDRGLVLISATRPMHVLAWPVTNPSADAAAPAFTVEIPGVGPAAVWPDAEFGLSMAALDRRLDQVLDDRTVRQVRWAVTEDELDPDIAWCPQLEDTAADTAFEAVCAQAWVLGDWVWPSATTGIGVFDGDVLGRNDLDAERLAEVLPARPGRVSALIRGTRIPTQEEVDAVLTLLSTLEAQDVLAPVADDDAQVIALPTFKLGLLELMAQTGRTEQQVRTAVWERSSQAARQVTHADPSEAAQARVDFALRQLLEETG